ncbi:MAG TPA: DUF6600 domain-containing protein [Candidatus Saccharimonadales bacterium]|nr:DUF6600 domain-containing protein [Candidatus Saccharimonadales bacterium]
MKTRALSWLVLFSLFLAVLFLVPSCALAGDDDPPSRVARLSYTTGQVSFSPAGTDDWVGAVLNRPVTTGDKLWTDQNSRAELQIGSAAIRLGDQTGFSFLNLDDRVMQIRLTEGMVSLRVRRMEQDETIEVDTPNLAFNILRPGRYRINVNEAGDTTVINVREGEGEVTGGGSAFTLHPNQQGYFTGTDSLTPDIESLAPEDGFDSWCNERDLREDHAVARRYVSDDVIGYEDLDEYGGWRPVPDYGTVWFPHVTTVGWAPYRYGHWAWISPWGWTWVDDAPWGFAPFHYGRWVFVGGGWGWVPCPPRPVAVVGYVRPVYAPALVAWVGGPHFAAGVAFGGGGFAAGVNVGWFPLGPREVFVPSYAVSRTYVNNVNISNTTVNQTVINNYYNTTIVNKNVTVNNMRYVNQSIPGAVTATSGHAFTSAQPVGRNLVAVNQREISGAPVAVHAPAVVPPRQAVLGSGPATNVRPPVALQSRAVVAKTAPPPPPPPFNVRQAAIEKNEGRPLSVSQAQQIQASQNHVTAPPVRIAPPARTVNPPINNNHVNYGQTNQPGPVNNRPPNTNTSVSEPNHPANVNPNQMHSYQDRPPASRTNTYSNPQLEQKHQQQIDQLQRKQDQQYEKLQQKQVQEEQHNKNQENQQQLEQKHQQQMQQLEQKQHQQQEVLQQKQHAEHQKAYKEPSSNNKPAPSSHEDKDKSHH